jgi:ABC-type bacteriocin/lantibiotic exporter with double-glycine peptidase domain
LKGSRSIADFQCASRPETIGQGLRWIVFDFLSTRRRWQIVGVFAIMLAGGVAELFTLAAVVPLIAVLAGPHGVPGSSKFDHILGALGLNISQVPLAALAGIFCAAAVGAAIVRITLAWSSQKLVFRIGYDLGVSLYSRVLHQPYDFHVQTNSSRIISDVAGVQRLLTGTMLPLMLGISSLVISFFILGGLLLISFQAALIAFAGMGGIYTAVSLWSRPRLRRNAEFIKASNRERVKTLQEGLGGIRDVLLDNSQALYVRTFSRIDARLRDAQASNALMGVTPRFVVEALGMIVILGLALMLTSEGSIESSVPVLAALALGAQRLLPLLQNAYNGWTTVTGSEAVVLSIVELLQLPVAERFDRRSSIAVNFNREIRANDLSFRYSPDAADVLRNIDFVIPRGSFVGFVGESGAGKTTLVDLLMGFLAPTEGAILIDGVPLTEDTLLSWQSHIAHVPQHIFLCDGSIIENVAFGLPLKKVDMGRVRLACRRAELDHFIESLPDSYNTVVGERGVRLSGGQRQRLGLARALYKQASLLVLDEATSALDDATEASVIDAVHRLGSEYTVLMIAHRVTTLQRCDIIFRLEKGQIAEQGTFEEVLGVRQLPNVRRRTENESRL